MQYPCMLWLGIEFTQKLLPADVGRQDSSPVQYMEIKMRMDNVDVSCGVWCNFQEKVNTRSIWRITFRPAVWSCWFQSRWNWNGWSSGLWLSNYSHIFWWHGVLWEVDPFLWSNLDVPGYTVENLWNLKMCTATVFKKGGRYTTLDRYFKKA